MHTNFYWHIYFILGSISLQSFYVVPCFSMTAFQRFGRFAIPFRVPLLFSPRMSRVNAAETSSREEKSCPYLGPFNVRNKSKSGGLTSALYGAWGNACHSYLLSKSVTTFPRCGRAFLYKMSGPTRESQVGFCAFFCPIFASRHDNKLLSHLFHIELYLSRWFFGDHKQRSSFVWPLIALVEVFWVAGRLDFFTRLTVISPPVQSL